MAPIRFKFLWLFFIAMISCSGLFGQSPLIIRSDTGALYLSDSSRLLLGSLNDQLVFLVFHAEEDSIGLDPGLSVPGRYRALNLKTLLRPVDLRGCFSTPFRNNILTLHPLAEDKRLETIYYDQGDLAALVARIDRLFPAAVIVAVHPQTTPQLLELLAGKPHAADTSQPRAEKLFVLNRDGKGKSSLRQLRYLFRQ
ncbi:MAG: hypothetical protein IT266_06220 [Saprospiraceae bacterium]|nr:hypothetical protein [Saprospiraceae bacterium]